MSAERPQKEKPQVRRVPTIALPCRECEAEGNRPCIMARVIDGELVISNDHHGRRHTDRYDLEWLKRLLAA